MAEVTPSQKIAAGVGILALAGAVFVIGGSLRQKATCKLTGAGVALIVDGLTRRETAGKIIASAGGGIVLDSVCEEYIESLVEQPEKPVPIEVQANNTSLEREVNAFDLTKPAPPPPDNGFGRIIDCLDWKADFLVQACWDNTIDPPQG